MMIDIHVYYDELCVIGLGSFVEFIIFDVTMIVGQMHVGDKKMKVR